MSVKVAVGRRRWYQVVQLTKDLDDNHVIQRCLTKLSSGDNQFISKAVG